MKTYVRLKQGGIPILAGLMVGLLSLFMSVQLATASSTKQTDEPPAVKVYTTQECQECHLDVTAHWEDSAHANAFADTVFQDRWVGMGEPAECLTCHTTNFDPTTGEFEAEGISCNGCHGEVTEEHPPSIVPIFADTEYCGTCHTTTLGEWHLTGHAAEDIGCMDCHDPHSQDALFDEPDALCLNCHEDTMGDYLEGVHQEHEIGCVACHALVIPPEEIPEDGIVPTGHAFNITPATCVACHTDTLHTGFSLPGYEHGAAVAVENGVNGDGAVVDSTEPVDTPLEAEPEIPAGLSEEQQIQALETALASQNVTLLFQGGIVGLALGGSTAWFMAHNVRKRSKEEQDDEEEK